jgi:hypothetical protein
MTDAPDRLDSWKAIAEYLGRDARTLRRWERLGLPIRRVAGSRGHSVFAFKSEIDAWLKTHPDEPVEPAAVLAPPPVPVAAPPVASAVVASPPPRHTPPTALRRWRFAIAAVVVIIAIVGWKAMAPAARQPLSVTVSPAAVIAKDAGGTEQWRYEFGPSLRNTVTALGMTSAVINGPDPAVLVQSSTLIRQSDEATLNGVLRWFSLDGRVERSFSFDDQWSFAGHPYREPWAMTDFRVDDSYGQRRIVLAAHHATWWPSVVTILDGRFQREGTFVNAGWVENVRWSSPDRLVISGFNQRLDGGMVAILDPHDMDGASPEPAGSPFVCDNCRGARPVAYAVLPRSELNRVTGSPFNRAIVEVTSSGIIAHTFEMDPNQMAGLTEAVYEFSPTLELRSASYGSRYWDQHHALELEGKIKHTRDNCPEREGPPLVKVWTRDAGWRDVRPKR